MKKLNKYVIKLIRTQGSKKINQCSKIKVAKSCDNFQYKANLGIYNHYNNETIMFLNVEKIGYWLNKGVQINSKPSWLVGLIGIKGKKKVVKRKLVKKKRRRC